MKKAIKEEMFHEGLQPLLFVFVAYLLWFY